MINKRKEKDIEQVWTDPKFKELLEKIRAKRILAGINCRSLTEVTRDLAENRKIREIIDKELTYGIKIIKEGEKDESKLF